MKMQNVCLKVLLIIAVLVQNVNTTQAQSSDQIPDRRGEAPLPRFPANEAQLYNSFLVSVSDIQVQTEVGTLPRLPAYVQGTYRDEMKGKGPGVRVVWPEATDNKDVLKPGRYTITGRVAGTSFQPKAVVIVYAAKKSVTPNLKLAPFD